MHPSPVAFKGTTTVYHWGGLEPVTVCPQLTSSVIHSIRTGAYHEKGRDICLLSLSLDMSWREHQTALLRPGCTATGTASTATVDPASSSGAAAGGSVASLRSPLSSSTGASPVLKSATSTTGTSTAEGRHLWEACLLEDVARYCLSPSLSLSLSPSPLSVCPQLTPRGLR